ncbi:MAG: PTS sugar transporter subunit IIA [Propioniciclava sp.]
MQILVVGHGGFPDGLLSAAQMIVGDQATDRVRAIGLQDVALFREQVAAALRPGDVTVVLADLLGGSPCNTVLEVAQELHLVGELQIVTGANLGLLIELILARKPPIWPTLIGRAAPRLLQLAPDDTDDDEL